MNIKHILTSILISCFLISSIQVLVSDTTYAEEFFYDYTVPNESPNQDKLELGQIIKQDNVTAEVAPKSVLYKIREFFGLAGNDISGTPYDIEKPAIAYVKVIMNRLLGLVSFIALVVTIFAFYQIFFGKGEEAVGKAKKMLMGVAIALAVMGLSRYIVSYFYDIYSVTTGTSIGA